MIERLSASEDDAGADVAGNSGRRLAYGKFFLMRGDVRRAAQAHPSFSTLGSMGRINDWSKADLSPAGSRRMGSEYSWSGVAFNAAHVRSNRLTACVRAEPCSALLRLAEDLP